MPTLEWIGKEKVVNHHQEVPYRVLERRYSFDEAGQHSEDNGSENMVIHGDNLEALKALLPRYEGKVKCIYIDPPYNTGEEGWVYNDNVNDPKIKKWLGEVVGREGEDLSRHDKWLCMIFPRLKLLQRLLTEDGTIFISIDDNELFSLKNICDEIFGQQNFIANFIWEKRLNRENRKVVSSRHDYILCYSKNISAGIKPLKQLPMSGEALERYSNPDNDPRGPWKSDPATAQAGHATQAQFYTLVAPNGKRHELPAGRCWLYTEQVMMEAIADGRIWFGESGNNTPRKKTYLYEKDRGLTPETIWFAVEVSTNEKAKNELKQIFSETTPFSTPKPHEIVERIIQIASDSDSIVLDSFAGSGSTAHAVLNMNKADGGKRKFILIEMLDYADSITAERIKRVISGYKADKETVLYDEEITINNLAHGANMLEEAKIIAKEAKEKYSSVKSPKIEEGHLRVVAVDKAKDMIDGLGGNFSYYELGPVLLLPDGNLNEDVGAEKIREYVYYMETKEPMPRDLPAGEPYFLGICRNTAYYFYYERDRVTTLDNAFLASIGTKAEGYTVYADLCAIPQARLQAYNITFKKIPRDIARL